MPDRAIGGMADIGGTVAFEMQVGIAVGRERTKRHHAGRSIGKPRLPMCDGMGGKATRQRFGQTTFALPCQISQFRHAGQCGGALSRGGKKQPAIGGAVAVIERPPAAGLPPGGFVKGRAPVKIIHELCLNHRTTARQRSAGHAALAGLAPPFQRRTQGHAGGIAGQRVNRAEMGVFLGRVRPAAKTHHHARGRLRQIVIAQMIRFRPPHRPAPCIQLHQDRAWVQRRQPFGRQAKRRALFIGAVHRDHIGACDQPL